MRAIALTLQDLRRAGGRGVLTGEQFAGSRKELPSGRPMPAGEGGGISTFEEAARFMAEHSGIPIAEYPGGNTGQKIDTAYRSASKTLHPDAGGGPGMFERLQEARDILLGEES